MNAPAMTTTPPMRRNVPRIYALETKSEFLKMLRLPMYAIPTLAFPTLFYLVFGVAMNRGSFDAASYMMATYGAFGVINAALFGIGDGIDMERAQGWLLLKRATPMPPLAYLAGKLAMAVLFGFLVVSLLSVLGYTLGGVRMPAGQWLTLIGVLVAGAVPFAAAGLAVGCWAGPNSAPAVINLVSMPAALLSGLWLPIQFLPKALQKIAPLLPPYHLGQLALKVLGKGQGGPAWQNVAVLAGFTVICLFLARAGWRRDEGRTFG
jgi:ABC-2 type transport system permease protein